MDSVLVWHAKEANVFSRDNAKAETQKHMEIGSKYNKIGNQALKNNIKIHSVILDENIKEIGQESFFNCTALRHIQMEDVRIIRKAAFYSCTRLQELYFPQTTEYVGSRAFSQCKRLKTLIFDEKSPCKEIHNETFSGCVMLEKVVLPDAVTAIGYRAFHRCVMLTDIKLPASLQSIGREAFYQNAFTQIELPETLEKIDEDAFFKCKELEYIKIPQNVQYIGKCAFHGCVKLKVLEFEDDPEYLGETIVNKSTTVRCKKGSKVEAHCKEAGIDVEYLA